MHDIVGIVFDKSGTIARGQPMVQGFIPTGDVTEDELLRVAASVEMNSEHPLARAVEDAGDSRELSLADTDGFESLTGHGVEATIDGATILVGKPAWLADRGIDLVSLDHDQRGREEAGIAVTAMALNGVFLGLIGIVDCIKDDAAQTIQRTKDAGITPVALSGDDSRTVHSVAARVGIDIAIDSADIVTMSDRRRSVMDTHEIGVSSYRRNKQNLALAFSLNGFREVAAVAEFVRLAWAMD